jgi:hypothetical protein
VTTSTDGTVPSVAPEPEDGSDAPATARGHDGGEEALDTGSSWLRAEIQRRIAAGRSGTAGRHARRDPVATSSIGYVPRHSIATPGPGAPRPGPVGGTPSPQPSELLRRERTSRQAWSGPSAPDAAPPEPVAPEAPEEDGATGDTPPTIGEPAEAASGDVLAQPVPDSDTPDAEPPADQPAPHPAPPPGSPADGPPATVDGAPGEPPPSLGPNESDPGPAASPAAGGAGSVPVGSSPDLAPPRLPQVIDAGPATASSGSDGGTAAADTVPTGPPPAPGPTPRRGTAEPARDAVSLPEQRSSAEEITARIPRVGSPEDLASRRVRVVLAERKRVAHPVRTVVDIQEGTGVGELLRTNLIGSQLAVALRFAFGAGLALGVLPLLFAMVPEIGRFEILGIRLPWLLLGGLVYPFLFGLGLWYARTSERVEQNFADHVQD